MFITNELTHQPFLSKLLGQGEEAWSSIRLSTQTEWFYISYRVPVEDGYLLETVMFTTITHFLDAFMGHKELGVDILEIYLVSQRPYEKIEGWRMEALAKIWRSKNPATGAFAYIYEMACGKRYGIFSSNTEDMTDYKLIMEITEVSV